MAKNALTIGLMAKAFFAYPLNDITFKLVFNKLLEKQKNYYSRQHNIINKISVAFLSNLLIEKQNKEC